MNGTRTARPVSLIVVCLLSLVARSLLVIRGCETLARAEQSGYVNRPDQSVLELRSQQSEQTHQISPGPQTAPLAKRGGVDTRRFDGCWGARIRQSDLTSLVPTGSLRLGSWFDEQYRVCISNGTATVSQTEISEENIVYLRSEARVVEVDGNRIRIRSRMVWDDMDFPTNGWRLPNGKPDPRPHPLPHPYEIVQQSDMTLTLENGRAVVVATANAAKVNGGPPAGEPADPAKYELPAYRLSWRADFEREK